MEDFDIDIISEPDSKNEPVQFPVNFLAIGEIENDDVKVYIKQRVYKACDKYLELLNDKDDLHLSQIDQDYNQVVIMKNQNVFWIMEIECF